MQSMQIKSADIDIWPPPSRVSLPPLVKMNIFNVAEYFQLYLWYKVSKDERVWGE